MSFWDYALPAIGGVGGFLIGGPGGAAVGTGLGSAGAGAIDSANQPDAPSAPSPQTAPTLNPNAGIGQGYGGLTPQEIQAQQAYHARVQASAHAGLEARSKLGAQAKALEDQAAAKTAAGDINGGLALQHQADAINKQIDDMLNNSVAAAGPAPTPDMSDQGRFAAQAMNSYTRTAPQAAVAQANLANVSSDRMQGGRDAGQQQNLINVLNRDMAGNGPPSLAQAQLAQTTDQNIAQQRSMAATAGPMDYAATARAAVMAGANTQQQALQQAAILRATEYANTRSQLGDATTQKRAQDLIAQGMDADTAMKQAQLEAQQNQFNTGQVQATNALNQSREMGYLGAYQNSQSMAQQNAIANLNAQVATNGSNNSAAAANYSTASNNAYQQAQMADQQRRDWANMYSSGTAAYQSSLPKTPPAVGAPAATPTAPTLQDPYAGQSYS